MNTFLYLTSVKCYIVKLFFMEKILAFGSKLQNANADRCLFLLKKCERNK